jgi:hypothetical protein
MSAAGAFDRLTSGARSATPARTNALAAGRENNDLRAEFAVLRAELKQAGRRLEAKVESMKSEIIDCLLTAAGLQALVILGALLALTR